MLKERGVDDAAKKAVAATLLKSNKGDLTKLFDVCDVVHMNGQGCDALQAIFKCKACCRELKLKWYLQKLLDVQKLARL